MARLTDKTLAQSTAITPTTLIHIVTTGDTSQNSAGSSYKAQLNQLAPTLGGYQYYSAITVTSAQTLSLNTSPVDILPSISGNQYYDMKVYSEYNYGTTAYTTSSALTLIGVSGTTLLDLININSLTGNSVTVATNNNTSAAGTLNTGVKLFQPSSNPTGGNGSLKLKVYYNIVSFG